MQSLISEQARDAKPWYAQRWPWFLMLGPFLVVLAGSYTCWLAFTRQDALVVGDYYNQGKAINKDLRRDRVATSLGLKFNLRYDAAAGALLGSVRGIGAAPADKLRLQLIHSTQPEKDIKLDVQPNPEGDFVIALPMLEMARWQVLLENARGDWRLNGSWAWPHQKQIEIKADAAAAE